MGLWLAFNERAVGVITWMQPKHWCKYTSTPNNYSNNYYSHSNNVIFLWINDTKPKSLCYLNYLYAKLTHQGSEWLWLVKFYMHGFTWAMTTYIDAHTTCAKANNKENDVNAEEGNNQSYHCAYGDKKVNVVIWYHFLSTAHLSSFTVIFL